MNKDDIKVTPTQLAEQLPKFELNLPSCYWWWWRFRPYSKSDFKPQRCCYWEYWPSFWVSLIMNFYWLAKTQARKVWLLC